MKKRSSPNVDALNRELAGLRNLDRVTLVDKWHSLYDIPPPAGVKNKFLMLAIAYRLQEQALGGLKPATRRLLEQATEQGVSRSKPLSVSMIYIKPGTKLLRQWHGTTHEVTVLEGSVSWSGKRYRSLSEVARAITGTRWSGPLFFGLRQKEVA